MNKRTYNDFLQTISRSPSASDLTDLAASMRLADQEEIRATGTLDRYSSLFTYLQDAVQTSDSAGVAYEPDTDIPLAIYGVGTFTDFPGVGFIWMHGTDALGTRCKQDFLRLGRFGVEELQENYKLLVCFADERNTLHTRWLRWMGFTPINRHLFADSRYPFLEFILPGRKEGICVPR